MEKRKVIRAGEAEGEKQEKKSDSAPFQRVYVPRLMWGAIMAGEKKEVKENTAEKDEKKNAVTPDTKEKPKIKKKNSRRTRRIENSTEFERLALQSKKSENKELTAAIKQKKERKLKEQTKLGKNEKRKSRKEAQIPNVNMGVRGKKLGKAEKGTNTIKERLRVLGETFEYARKAGQINKRERSARKAADVPNLTASPYAFLGEAARPRHAERKRTDKKYKLAWMMERRSGKNLKGIRTNRRV